MARILIVENQSFFSKALATDLAALGHFFVHAETAKAAHDILEREDFDCLIVDAKMTGFSGVEFTVWVQDNKPTPIILMADFADQADAVYPFGLAGVTLLIKPFSLDGVQAALLNAIPEETFARARATSGNLALIALPKRGLKSSGVAEFNLYHYVDGYPRKILERGDTYVLRDLPVPLGTRFYTDRESLKNLLDSSVNMAALAGANRTIPAEKKAALMQDVLQIANEQLSLMAVDAQLAEATAEILKTYFRSFDDGAVWEIIADLDSFSRPVYAQTLASVLTCLLIAQQYEMSTQDCFKLITAAVFHDVGMTTLDPVLIKTPRALLSMKDRQTLDRHVDIGVVILQKTGWVSPEICTIVGQHHENDTGNGFPRGLKAAQLHPMARILRIADEFALSVMKSGGHRGIPPLRAIELLKEKPELDQKSIAALHRALSIKQNI